MAGEDKRRLREDIEHTDDELRKLRADEQRRRERIEEEFEEDVQTKSRMLGRDIIGEGEDRLSGSGPDGDDDTGRRQDGKKKRKWGSDETEDDMYGIPFTRGRAAPPAAGLTAAAPADRASAVTGRLTPRPKPTLIAKSPGGVMRELVIRQWDGYLRWKQEQRGARLKDIYQQMWLLSKAGASVKEDMLGELRKLEESSGSRLERMNELSRAEARGKLNQTQEKELHSLEDGEARRYMLRERLLGKTPLAEQEKMTWLQPLGGGAYSVMPYTFLTTWDLLSNKERAIARWYYDNTLLRWQHAVVGRFIPRKADMSWFKKKKRVAIERLFEDVDEEIYSDKKFAELVKTGQAQLEDVEEELTGYDRFTVEEEQQIKRMFEEEIRRQLELERTVEAY